MKEFFVDLVKRLAVILACVLITCFFVAAVSDWLMGCGEGYHTAAGYVEPDNKGCFFSSER